MLIWFLKKVEQKLNDFIEGFSYIPKNAEIKDYDHKGKMVVLQDFDIFDHCEKLDIILADFFRIRDNDPHANFVVYDVQSNRHNKATPKRRYIVSINPQYINVRCVGDPNNPND